MVSTVAILLPSILGRGGTERAVTNVANMFSDNGIKVFIFSTDTTSGNCSYNLNPSVVVKHLGLKLSSSNLFAKFTSLFSLRFKLKKIITENKIQVLMGTYTLLNCMLVLLRKQAKVIGCEHFNYGSAGKLNSFLRKKNYPKLNAVVVLTEEDAKNYSFMPKEKLFVIPNSLPFKAKRIAAYKNHKVLSIGRLTHQKGFDTLVDIVLKIHPNFPDWEFLIVGEGPDFLPLKNQIASYKLENTVSIIPPQSDVLSLYGQASIYAMTSRFEGLPMVLLEALSCGLPIVSFDCPYGPSTVIKDGQNGFLVPAGNQNEFIEKISLLMQDEVLREKFGGVAFDDSNMFSKERILECWFSLLPTVGDDTEDL